MTLEKKEIKLSIEIRKEIISDIKNKKELKYVDDCIVSDLLGEYFKENKNSLKEFSKELSFKRLKRKAIYKTLLKEIRKKIRIVYGVFKPENPSEKPP